jgi:hypothetical protein
MRLATSLDSKEIVERIQFRILEKYSDLNELSTAQIIPLLHLIYTLRKNSTVGNERDYLGHDFILKLFTLLESRPDIFMLDRLDKKPSSMEAPRKSLSIIINHWFKERVSVMRKIDITLLNSTEDTSPGIIFEDAYNLTLSVAQLPQEASERMRVVEKLKIFLRNHSQLVN